MIILFSVLISCLFFVVGDVVFFKVKDVFSCQYMDVLIVVVIWGVEEEDFVVIFFDVCDCLVKVFFFVEGEWEEIYICFYLFQLFCFVCLYYEVNYEDKDVFFIGSVQYVDGLEFYWIEWEIYEVVYIEEISLEGGVLEFKCLFFIEGLDIWQIYFIYFCLIIRVRNLLFFLIYF